MYRERFTIEPDTFLVGRYADGLGVLVEQLDALRKDAGDYPVVVVYVSDKFRLSLAEPLVPTLTDVPLVSVENVKVNRLSGEGSEALLMEALRLRTLENVNIHPALAFRNHAQYPYDLR